jgi:hypothetical protein
MLNFVERVCMILESLDSDMRDLTEEFGGDLPFATFVANEIKAGVSKDEAIATGIKAVSQGYIY